jgi:hypothetical protein
VELITKFWPFSIDRLNPETGVADGSRPFFFTNSSDESDQLVQFLFGDTGNPIEFGAQQCKNNECLLANYIDKYSY